MSGGTRHFVRQAHPQTCVAACVAMIRSWRGQPTTEGALRDEWGEPPYTLLVHAQSDGHVEIFDPIEPKDLELLRVRVSQGWVVVMLVPEPRRMAHAVVLVEAFGDEGFRYLDPAEPLSAQPLEITTTQLVEIWTGYALIA